jgi:diguanylate cyclase (GGDEF)-like protein/PAS domain S-box-containing protein
MREKPRHLPVLALGLVASAGVLFFPIGSPGGDGLYAAIAITAAVLAWRGASAGAGGSRALRPIATGLVLSVVGDLLYAGIFIAQGGSPMLSIADVGWVGSYVAIAVGLMRLAREHSPGRREDVDGLIDLAAVFVVVVLLAWTFVIAPTLADGSLPLTVRIRESVYPALDAAVLALVVRVVAGRRRPGPMVLLVAAGVGCWLAADLGSLIIGAADGDNVWGRLGWLSGEVLLAAAVWQRPDRPRPDAPGPTDREIGSGRIAIALLPLTIPPVVELLGHLRGSDTQFITLFVATIVLVALAFARAVRLSQEATAARELVHAQARFNAAVAANSSDAVVVLDAEGRMLRDAPQFAALVGRAGSPTRGRSLLDFAVPVDVAAARELMRRAMEEPGAVIEGEFHFTIADDRDLWLGVRLRDLIADPDVGGLVCNLHDITSRKLAEERLEHQALHDGLTGLANRALLLDRLDQSLRRAGRTGRDPAVIYLDLDGFKDVNDSLGHAAGDLLLQEVSQRLLAAVRGADTVARLGGDEFALLIEESPRPVEEAEVVSARILQALSAPIDLGERPVLVSASLGIAVSGPLATATSLLRDADIAMYQAKEMGRGRAVMFDPQMLSATVARIEMETELAGALAAGQLHLVYQPVVTLDTERVVGFEALLRWRHPKLGMVPPDTFVPIAERSGLIDTIGRWVLHEACTTVAAWHAATPTEPPLSIAVNVSGRQLASEELVAQVTEVLQCSGLAPSSLILEMTETSLVQDALGTTRVLQALRALGIRLAIDDFGTGYSSLSYLRQFPIDILKIDRTFVETITTNDHVPPIMRGLLDLGRTLNLEIIAEGVELDVQRDRLRRERCDLAQGYLFAHPMSADEAERLSHVSAALGPVEAPAGRDTATGQDLAGPVP